MPPAHVATAADYADAMMIARKWKNALVALLLLFLLFQIAAFFVARQTSYLLPPAGTGSIAAAATPAAGPATAPSDSTVSTPASTQPTAAATAAAPTVSADTQKKIQSAVRHATEFIDFVGIVAVLVLAVVVLLITVIMLVGRLIGVAQVASGFIWCVLLAALLFPWQYFFESTSIPGVFYTWGEFTNDWSGARFVSTGFDSQTILHWARFVGWPAVALVLVLVVQAKSSRGLRAALGETELDGQGDIHVS